MFGEYPHFRNYTAYPNARIEVSGTEHVEAALKAGGSHNTMNQFAA